MFFFRRSGIEILLLFLAGTGILSSPLRAQSSPDSLRTRYDSLQDVRSSRFEHSVRRQFNRVDESQVTLQEMIDSVRLVMEEVLVRLDRMEDQQQSLSQTITRNQEAFSGWRESSMVYRQRLHRWLWMTGSAMFILIVSVFLFLLIFSLRTRNLLEKVMLKQQQILIRQKEMGDEARGMEKGIRKEILARDRKVRKKIKVVREEIRNETHMLKTKLRNEMIARNKKQRKVWESGDKSLQKETRGLRNELYKEIQKLINEQKTEKKQLRKIAVKALRKRL